MLLLRPLSALYGAAMAVRNLAFDRGWLPSSTYEVPTIAVGNLAVGGTGKTPHAEYLLRLLAPRRRTALLSRGYGRRTRGYVRADAAVGAADIGDEPYQVWRKMPQVAVAVCEDRRRGMQRLLAEDVDAVVLDDAYQHRYVRAGRYVLLTDYHRLYSDDHVLPEGRLREGRRGARRADVIIVTKCPADSVAWESSADEIRRRLCPAPHQRVFFTTFVYDLPQHFLTGAPLADAPWDGRDVLVVTGVAHPESLYRHIEGGGGRVHPLRFADHHRFTAADLQQIADAYAALPPGVLVVTTEKDAARLAADAEGLEATLRQALLVQPIRVEFLFDSQKDFDKYILDYVANYPTNRGMDT